MSRGTMNFGVTAQLTTANVELCVIADEKDTSVNRSCGLVAEILTYRSIDGH
jgi:hypothetical protein